MKSQHVLFVCLGNICRSPTAEAIFRKRCEELGLTHTCDSAGTAGYHIGSPSDPRSIAHAKKAGYPMTHRGRKAELSDLQNFDWILAMDSSNLENLRNLDPSKGLHHKIKLVTEFSENWPDGVPDPYHGQAADFDLVIEILEEAVDGFIQFLESSRAK